MYDESTTAGNFDRNSLKWGTPGDRLCENPLLTSITFLIGIHGYRIFIVELFHN